MPTTSSPQHEPRPPRSPARGPDTGTAAPRLETRQPRGLLAGMRIRKKLMFLHTLFSTVLAVVLVLALHPAITNIVLQAQSERLTDILRFESRSALQSDSVELAESGITIQRLSPDRVSPDVAAAARSVSSPIVPERTLSRTVAYIHHAGTGEFVMAELRSRAAFRAVLLVDVLIILAVLGVYAIVAASLELFVLPRHVYGPLRAALRADEAVRTGDRSGELIPTEMMPADELGAIMRSRNESVSALRAGEAQLADTLDRLESVATDLKRKNHLLENARKNLEGADRLRSLGMMSAGIAHEINTPLAVAKGLVEKLENQRSLSESESALLGRVITRLESLSDSLLDFARARSLEPKACRLADLAEEAASLVRLDRNTMPKGEGIRLVNAVPGDLTLECEPDRIIQVLVNLVRNAVNAIRGAGADSGSVALDAVLTDRDGQHWVQLTVTDTGPGIDPEVLPSLFEPFVSTRLDARGTGLGLAVAEGIVREHGGTVIARNRPDRAGAIFEVMLPQETATLGARPDPRPESDAT